MKKNKNYFKIQLILAFFISISFLGHAQNFEDKTIDALVPTPVLLTSFDALKTNSNIVLSWKTATEINNSHFIIERSNDGINFGNIGQVVGRGNANLINNYSFIDINTPTINLFYRLKQVDINGNAVYSKIIFVKAIKNSNAAFSIYPNPVTQFKATINISHVPTDKYIFNIKSIDGKMVYQTNQNLTTLNTVFILQIPTSLQAGIYLLQITNIKGDINLTQKLILK